MDIVAFNAKHLPAISDALSKHNMPQSLLNELPEVGYVGLINGQFIAAAFLRIIEGDMALVDSMITDPSAKGSDRFLVLDALTLQLIEKAKELNIKALVAHTTDGGTIMRAKRLGFHTVPTTVLALNLSTKAE